MRNIKEEKKNTKKIFHEKEKLLRHLIMVIRTYKYVQDYIIENVSLLVHRSLLLYHNSLLYDSLIITRGECFNK